MLCVIAMLISYLSLKVVSHMLYPPNWFNFKQNYLIITYLYKHQSYIKLIPLIMLPSLIFMILFILFISFYSKFNDINQNEPSLPPFIYSIDFVLKYWINDVVRLSDLESNYSLIYNDLGQALFIIDDLNSIPNLFKLDRHTYATIYESVRYYFVEAYNPKLCLLRYDILVFDSDQSKLYYLVKAQ